MYVIDVNQTAKYIIIIFKILFIPNARDSNYNVLFTYNKLVCWRWCKILNPSVQLVVPGFEINICTISNIMLFRNIKNNVGININKFNGARCIAPIIRYITLYTYC